MNATSNKTSATQEHVQIHRGVTTVVVHWELMVNDVIYWKRVIVTPVIMEELVKVKIKQSLVNVKNVKHDQTRRKQHQ
jgi:hypothetical protein